MQRLTNMGINEMKIMTRLKWLSKKKNYWLFLLFFSNAMQVNADAWLNGDPNEIWNRSPGVYKEASHWYAIFHAAPGDSQVKLQGDFTNGINNAISMTRTPDGNFWWFKGTDASFAKTPEHGDEYRFSLVRDGQTITFQDPAARWVSVTDNNTGMSKLVLSDDYQWGDTNWTRQTSDQFNIYQLHPLRFTDRNIGSPLAQVTEELDNDGHNDYLNNLGITAVELLPVNEFFGDLSWGYNPNFYFAPDQYYAEAMDSMYVPISETFDGRRIIDTKKLKYLYFTFDREGAARKSGKRSDFVKRQEVAVYPDTTVWVKDFNYSYNDPMHQDYFWHQAYNDYPVVGVTWQQAKAFCEYRTQKKNKFLRSSKKKSAGRVPSFRLPTEAEWEYAARGGLEYAKYPWGGPYTVSDRGCFLANFKPERGDYAADGALYTMEAKSFLPNDYGLYNMAGNVAEWTNTAYNPASYYLGSTMNPNVDDSSNKRKVVRGGSWKDVAYFLEVSTRDYEYGDSARSFIGFRTVQDFMGTKMKDK